jgi:hypothetical protein
LACRPAPPNVIVPSVKTGTCIPLRPRNRVSVMRHVPLVKPLFAAHPDQACHQPTPSEQVQREDRQCRQYDGGHQTRNIRLEFAAASSRVAMGDPLAPSPRNPIAVLLVLGVKTGLKLDTVLSVLRATAASNTHLKSTYKEKALRRDFSPGFATRLAVKDLRLAMGLAIDERLPVGIGAAALQLFSTACGQGHATDDYTSVITVLEKLADIELCETAEVLS